LSAWRRMAAWRSVRRDDHGQAVVSTSLVRIAATHGERTIPHWSR
jgi:hypothetical protein